MFADFDSTFRMPALVSPFIGNYGLSTLASVLFFLGSFAFCLRTRALAFLFIYFFTIRQELSSINPNVRESRRQIAVTISPAHSGSNRGASTITQDFFFTCPSGHSCDVR